MQVIIIKKKKKKKKQILECKKINKSGFFLKLWHTKQSTVTHSSADKFPQDTYFNIDWLS